MNVRELQKKLTKLVAKGYADAELVIRDDSGMNHYLLGTDDAAQRGQDVVDLGGAELDDTELYIMVYMD